MSWHIAGVLLNMPDLQPPKFDHHSRHAPLKPKEDCLDCGADVNTFDAVWLEVMQCDAGISLNDSARPGILIDDSAQPSLIAWCRTLLEVAVESLKGLALMLVVLLMLPPVPVVSEQQARALRLQML